MPNTVDAEGTVAAGFMVEATSGAVETLIAVTGELDAYTSPRLRRALGAIECHQRVIIDASAITFIDSSGLGRSGGRPPPVVGRRTARRTPPRRPAYRVFRDDAHARSARCRIVTMQEIPRRPRAEPFRVERDGPGVRVTWRGDVRGADVERLSAILVDLVDGQGNLTVAVQLPDLAAVDLPLLEVLVEIQDRLAVRSGTLSVTTRIGRWEPAANNNNWRNHA